MRDVSGGWLLDIFMEMSLDVFYSSFLHTFRGLYYDHLLIHDNFYDYRSFNSCMYDCNAFMGYVLPWGQMSFWEQQL